MVRARGVLRSVSEANAVPEGRRRAAEEAERREVGGRDSGQAS